MSWSPFGTVDNIGELSIWITGNGSGTFTDQIDHFLDMKLQIFKSNNKSWVIGIEIFLVPLYPIVSYGVIVYRRVVLDGDRNRIGGDGRFWQGHVFGIGNKIGTMFWTVWPFRSIGMGALFSETRVIDKTKQNVLVMRWDGKNQQSSYSNCWNLPNFASKNKDLG